MKKIAILIILIATLYSSPAFAQNSTATSTPRTKAQDLKEERKDNRQEMKDEKIEKMNAFKAQIKELKDLRKQGLVEKINEKIANSNKRLTDKMGSALNNLTSILERVKNRSAAYKVEGKDTAALDSAISSAETAVTTALTAVATQANKEYTATITDETTLKNTIGQMVSQFRKDIQSVHKLVVDARQAVAKAIAEAAKLRGEEKTATGSANM